MSIDWMLVATIAAPVLALFVGAALDRLRERKPKVIAYYAHASAFTIRHATNPPQTIHTHSIVIRNVGRRTATNVRVRHLFLPPNFNVYPDRECNVRPLPGGGAEIVFPMLISGEQVLVSYLYFPPLLFNQIHSGICHDEGFARELQVLPTPQLPRWQARLYLCLMAVGVVALLYALAELLIRLRGRV